ncbi:hypothetical protein CPB83DRAFT_864730 [Crepidotus variabilis]|uniref:Protein farnesyltransferase/geranylgeranyltransferase type-1 subunit alpha n=1 Tax=Crepidotus variabilis TaxID=179855 RepID=A0A9P6E460_9AGAR|nr:hypothetical protein CPB83DRAFT_864730 [Crepidotus variabilis]
MFDDDELLFSERPEWSDVTPLEQYENLNPLAPIFYTDEYKDATNYLRAIVKSGEKTKRVLELTENIIKQNPAHYSAWQYRYETFITLLFPSSPPKPSKALATNPMVIAELALMDELAVRFLKTYQVWHHRRLLVALTRQPRRELGFIKKSLEADAKNYHTWSYRQWTLAFFGGAGGGGGVAVESSDENDIDFEVGEDLWAGELDFVDAMLAQDIRNNSAWHHRFFVVWGCGVREGELDRERISKRELIFVKQHISFAPNNPSAWNYLRGILRHTSTPFSSVAAFAEPYTSSKESISRDNIVDLDNPRPGEGAELPCSEALEFMADVHEAKTTEEGVNSAVEIWKNLATEHDTMRKKYWEHRIRSAHRSLNTATNAA